MRWMRFSRPGRPDATLGRVEGERDVAVAAKTYEYLATGLPVVATRWPEIEAMQAPIALTERDGFTDALRDTLAVGRTEGADERQAYARANSWDARFRTVLEAISPFLEGVLDAPRT